MKNLKVTIPAAIFALCSLYCVFADLLIGGDDAVACIYIFFPLLGLLSCFYFACICAPKWSWIFPVASWLVESAAARVSPLEAYHAPTFWGPVLGYLIGLVLWAVSAAWKKRRRAA